MAGVGVPGAVVETLVQKPNESNIAASCQTGQDLVQELVYKITEVVTSLKLMQLPNGSAASLQATGKASNRIHENLKQIEFCFHKLRQVFNECQRRLPDDVDPCVLIPYVKNSMSFDAVVDELPLQKSNKVMALEQRKAELEAILTAKNDQFKILLDELRSLVWEINSILALQYRP